MIVSRQCPDLGRAVAAHRRSRTHSEDSESDIVELNIPTGVPLVYELDSELKLIKHYYLDGPDEIRKAQKAVANQGRATSGA